MIYINDNKAIDFRHTSSKLDLDYVLPKQGRKMSGVQYVSVRSTECDILEVKGDKDFVVLGTGVSKCDSRDNFSKERGRKRALARALQSAGISRDERRIVWEKYFSR